MYVVKVLKRRDAASVVVAIYIALALSMWLPSTVGRLSGWISGVSSGQYISYTVAGASWQVAYLQPMVYFLLQLLVLEALLWVVVWLHPMFVRKSK